MGRGSCSRAAVATASRVVVATARAGTHHMEAARDGRADVATAASQQVVSESLACRSRFQYSFRGGFCWGLPLCLLRLLRPRPGAPKLEQALLILTGQVHQAQARCNCT